jgi:hypothetical protein
VTIRKPHLEFGPVDLAAGWTTPPGYPSGYSEKILAAGIDEAKRVGSRTRLLRIAAGAVTTAPVVHDYWEEVYVVQGDLTVGHDGTGAGGETFLAPSYCCRPPGIVHGPFKSERGALLLEFHYYV